MSTLIEDLFALRRPTEHGRFAEKGPNDDFNEGVDAAIDLIERRSAAEVPVWRVGMFKNNRAESYICPGVTDGERIVWVRYMTTATRLAKSFNADPTEPTFYDFELLSDWTEVSA